jgi:hypothetical protein
MDTNMPSHDKILALLSDKSPRKWQAVTMCTFGILWSVGQGTDGHVPTYALKAIHGSSVAARLLVKYNLWTEAVEGWNIVNFDDRQQLSDQVYTVRKSQSIGGKQGNCRRWHDPSCRCYEGGPVIPKDDVG